MSGDTSIPTFLRSDDPLSDAAIDKLVRHAEEDKLVDYKVAFDPENEKEWLEINIDVAAFANTYGGYLVFGVRDKTYEVVGIPEIAYNTLTDIKRVQEKLNRYVQPKFVSLRSKGRDVDGKRLVVLLIPQSKNKTHIFTSNGDVKYPNGNVQTVIRQGNVHVRKSGSNQVITADDFEDLLHRRFSQIKEKLLDGIARVVKADVNDEVVVVAPTRTSGGEIAYRVTDSSEALPVKGISFSITPQSDEERVAAWIALNKGDTNSLPHEKSLMALYANRRDLHLTNEQAGYMAYFSLIKGFPAFYYLKTFKRDEIQDVLERAYIQAAFPEKLHILSVSAFIGERVYDNIRGRLKRLRTGVAIPTFPGSNLIPVFKVGKLSDIPAIDEEATQLAKELAGSNDISKLYRLIKLDCGLYADFS